MRKLNKSTIKRCPTLKNSRCKSSKRRERTKRQKESWSRKIYCVNKRSKKKSKENKKLFRLRKLKELNKWEAVSDSALKSTSDHTN